MFQFVASDMVTGTLQFGVQYGEFTTPVGLPQGSTQYYSLFSLDRSARRVMFKFPNPTPFTWFKTDADHYNTAGSEMRRENFSGLLHVMVQNSLVVAANAPSSVTVLVYHRAPDVMLFQKKEAAFLPQQLSLKSSKKPKSQKVDVKNPYQSVVRRQKLPRYQGEYAPFHGQYERQGGEIKLLDDDEEFEEQSGLVSRTAVHEPTRGHYTTSGAARTEAGAQAAVQAMAANAKQSTMVVLGPEMMDMPSTTLMQYTSMRPHLKQYYRMQDVEVVPTNNYLIRVSELQENSFWDYYSSLYAAWRGTVLFKMIVPDNIIINGLFTPLDTGLVGDTDGVPANNCFKFTGYRGAPGPTVAIPFITQYNFLATPEVRTGTEDPDFYDPGVLYFWMTPGEPAYMSTYFCGGDEFRMGCVIGTPLVDLYL